MALWAAAGVLAAQTAAPPKPAPAATKAPVKPAAPVREPGLYTTIQTSLGPITLKLYEKEAPITVKNFTDLALGRKEWTDPKTQQRVKRPLYPGLTFHRVIPGFMIQGGDPTGTGMGSTDVIPDEISPSLTFDRPGRLAMANAGPQTGSCQFFITEVPTTYLNGRHTIFGQVVQGQEVVEKIARVPRDAEDKPRTPVRIVSIRFNRVGPGTQPGRVPAPVKPRPAGVKPGTSRPAATKPAAAKPKSPATQSSGTSK